MSFSIDQLKLANEKSSTKTKQFQQMNFDVKKLF